MIGISNPKGYKHDGGLKDALRKCRCEGMEVSIVVEDYKY